MSACQPIPLGSNTPTPSTAGTLLPVVTMEPTTARPIVARSKSGTVVQVTLSCLGARGVSIVMTPRIRPILNWLKIPEKILVMPLQPTWVAILTTSMPRMGPISYKISAPSPRPGSGRSVKTPNSQGNTHHFTVVGFLNTAFIKSKTIDNYRSHRYSQS